MQVTQFFYMHFYVNALILINELLKLKIKNTSPVPIAFPIFLIHLNEFH